VLNDRSVLVFRLMDGLRDPNVGGHMQCSGWIAHVGVFDGEVFMEERREGRLSRDLRSGEKCCHRSRHAGREGRSRECGKSVGYAVQRAGREGRQRLRGLQAIRWDFSHDDMKRGKWLGLQ
jgi:hypothetical protein